MCYSVLLRVVVSYGMLEFSSAFFNMSWCAIAYKSAFQCAIVRHSASSCVIARYRVISRVKSCHYRTPLRNSKVSVLKCAIVRCSVLRFVLVHHSVL